MATLTEDDHVELNEIEFGELDDSLFPTLKDVRSISHKECIPLRVNIKEMDLGVYTQKVRYSHGKTKRYCPTGFISADRVQIYQNLNCKLTELLVKQEAIPHPSSKVKYEQLMRFIIYDEKNNNYLPFTYSDYRIMRFSYDMEMVKHNQNLQEYTSQIASLSKYVVEEKARITKIAELRGNTPTFPPNVINAESNIKQLEKNIKICTQKCPEKPEILVCFPTYSAYEIIWNKFSKSLQVYERAKAVLQPDIDLIRELMLMEIWRKPYSRYAREHNIDVDENSDELFIECNSDHFDYLHNLCDCELNEFENRHVGGTLGFILADNLDSYDSF
jgi:hypothetical protein